MIIQLSAGLREISQCPEKGPIKKAFFLLKEFRKVSVEASLFNKSINSDSHQDIMTIDN